MLPGNTISYRVHYTSTQVGSDCIPCIAIEICRNKDEVAEWVCHHIGNKGLFNSPEEAENAAKEIKVSPVCRDGTLYFDFS